MSYHDDELVPPAAEFTDSLIRAASLSALLLTACSEPKPAAQNLKTLTELVRPAEAQPDIKYLPATSAANVKVDPKKLVAHARNVAKAHNPTTAGKKRPEIAAQPQPLPDVVTEIAQDNTEGESTVSSIAVQDLPPETSAALETPDTGSPDSPGVMSELTELSAKSTDLSAPIIVEITPEIVVPALATTEPLPLTTGTVELTEKSVDSAITTADDDAAPLGDEDVSDLVFHMEVTPIAMQLSGQVLTTLPVVAEAPITPEQVVQDDPDNASNPLPEEPLATASATEPLPASPPPAVEDAALEAPAPLPNPKPAETAVMEGPDKEETHTEITRPKGPERQQDAALENLRSVPNRAVLLAMAAAIRASEQQESKAKENIDIRIVGPSLSAPAPAQTHTEVAPGPVDDVEDEAEWEARMQTSQAPASTPEQVAVAPKNLSSSSFAQKTNDDPSGNSLTLNIAALGDAPIGAYFVAESVGNVVPHAPASNDPNWQAIEPASAFGGEQAYALKESYADNTPVNLHVWFKDAKGNVSAPARSKVTVTHTDTTLADISEFNPYIVDTVTGFKDWTYKRGANQMGSAKAGRAKARADADNFFLSPPLKMPSLKPKAELVLQLRQWYQFSADNSLAGGARPTVDVAIEKSPGQWSEWAPLLDTDISISDVWTAPRFDIANYAGATIKLRIGITGNLRSLSDWGLSDVSISVESPIEITPHSSYAQGFEEDWNRWSSRLPQWSMSGPGLDGTVVASEGLQHVSAKPNGTESGDFSLTSPTFQLPNSPVNLSFSEWHNFAQGDGKLQISYFDRVTGWREWGDLGRTISGRSARWQTVQADLTPYAGMRVRLRLLAHLTPSDTVWRVDEFLLTAP